MGLDRVAIVKRMKKLLANLFAYLILSCVVFLIIFPISKNISAMFKSFNDLLDKSVVFIPREPGTLRIKETVAAMKYWNAFGNSFILCSLCAFLQMLSCTLTAYGFARFNFPLKRLWFALVIFSMMIPAALLMPSLYIRFSEINILGLLSKSVSLIDTFIPLTLMSVLCIATKNGLYIYLLRQFFMNSPKELEESGRIDGAGTLRIFFSIMLPSAVPLLITVFMFAFCWQWTDIYWTNVYMPNFRGIPEALSRLSVYGSGQIQPVIRTALMNTGLILVILPILILFLFLQRFFVQGITRSGIVG